MLDPRTVEQLSQRKPLSEAVFDAIRENIIAGRFQSGEWLRQEDLASQLGVSQTPIRQALERLVAERLAERVPYRGVRVFESSDQELADVYVLRLQLEGPIIRLATPLLSEDRILDLGQSLSEADRLMTSSPATVESIAKRRRLNRHFHGTIGQACGSRALGMVYEMLLNTLPEWRLYEGMLGQEDMLSLDMQEETQEHRDILGAIAARDVDLAERRAIGHVAAQIADLPDSVGVKRELVEARLRQLWPREDLLAEARIELGREVQAQSE
jgi:DNA-binding GntR family transcriptional regulator